MRKVIKLKKFNYYLLLSLLLISYGCAKSSSKSEVSDIVPELKVFGKADATANILEIIPKENNIALKAEIADIKTYTKAESQDILLLKNDIIVIEVSGIGNKKDWNASHISAGEQIKIMLRCLDSRVNSLSKFTKEDCYWEGNDESIEVIS